MADIRIKDLATTATTTASDDFMAVDGVTNGTRKLSAATPAFLTSVTTPSLTSPASTNLTLAGGSSGASLVLGQGANGGATITTVGSGVLTATGGNIEITTAAKAFFQTSSQSKFGDASGVITGGSGIDTAIGYFSGGKLIFGITGGVEMARLTDTGNLLIGTTSATGLTGAGGLKINSTTAGASNAGALVVAGGISAGAASYFGGDVTAAGPLLISGGGRLETNGLNLLDVRPLSGGAFRVLNAAATVAQFSISESTGAATFAGAVTIGNTVNTVSPTSPNRTITMVVGGVTLYIAAKTTND